MSELGEASRRAEPVRLTVPIEVPSWWLTAVKPVAAAVLLLAALLLGGGTMQATRTDAIVELVSLPVLAIALAGLSTTAVLRRAAWPLILLGAILILPLLQLIPLSPAQWGALPARELIQNVYHAVGLQRPWMPVSVTPLATWRSFLSMLPAAAMFLMVLSLGVRARRALMRLFLCVVLVDVGLSLLQMTGGQGSPLRFYETTNLDRAVGLFANANHNAALLYCAIPFAVALVTDFFARRRAISVIWVGLAALVFVGAYGALALTESRAGLALGFLSGVLSLAVMLERVGRRRRRAVLWVASAAMLLAALTVFQFGFVNMMQRISSSDLKGNLRWKASAITLEAGWQSFPYGTGLGSFVPVFRSQEPRALVVHLYVNHAHNDWAETFMEGGLPACLLTLGFLVWFVSAARRPRNREGSTEPGLDRQMAQAATIGVVMLMLHSTVDYPLRTIAMMTLFGLFCGLLMPPQPTVDEVVPHASFRRRRGNATIPGSNDP